MCGFLASTNLETRDQHYQQNETYTASALFAGTSSDTRERKLIVRTAETTILVICATYLLTLESVKLF